MSPKDWLEKDYYKILGVSKNASEAEIKKAFRKLARQNHPDRHPGDKKAEARFKEVSEANDVLSDPDKRKKYDQQRSLLGAGGGIFQNRSTAGSGGGINDLFRHATKSSSSNSMFSDLFGGLFGDERTTTRGPKRGADVESGVTINFNQAVSGATVTIPLVSEQSCKVCQGTGGKPGSTPKVCPACEGSGMQNTSSGGVFQMSQTCLECSGSGLIYVESCPNCSGSGREKSRRSVAARIPAGVEDGKRIRLKGKGAPGQNGGSNGDLYVVVHVQSHPIFGRSGDNITLTVPVTFTEAALGGQIEVPTLSGTSVKLKIQPGTPNGRTLRIPGRGVSRRDGTKGDQLVTLEVVVPQHLGAEARQALENYAELISEPNPRESLLRR